MTDLIKRIKQTAKEAADRIEELEQALRTIDRTAHSAARYASSENILGHLERIQKQTKRVGCHMGAWRDGEYGLAGASDKGEG